MTTEEPTARQIAMVNGAAEMYAQLGLCGKLDERTAFIKGFIIFSEAVLPHSIDAAVNKTILWTLEQCVKACQVAWVESQASTPPASSLIAVGKCIDAINKLKSKVDLP